ncbi:porin, partial [Enterobacter sp. DRP3]|nr:porin [Enterobacter sp. DRP3]
NEAHGSGCRARPAHAGLRFTVAVACLAGSGAALAQDGVTLYGVIDEFAQVVNTGNGYTAAIDSGGQWGSRFGLKGGEDIGGGQKIEFALENGFNPTDGSLASAGT